MVVLLILGVLLNSECLLPLQKTTNLGNQPLSLSLQEKTAFDKNLYHQYQFPFISYSCLPQHIHLSQASNINDNDAAVDMTISFELDFSQCQNLPSPPYIIYGKQQPQNYWKLLLLQNERQVAGSPLRYNFTSSLSGEYFESNWIYHVTLPNLVPHQEYWYQIIVPTTANFDGLHLQTTPSLFNLRGLRSLGGKSPVLHFRTPPTSTTPTSIALVGDIGQTLNSTKTMAHIYKSATSSNCHHHHPPPPPPISLVMIAGDLSYADSDPHRWPRWLSLMEPLLRRVPLATAAGNHEIECDETTGNVFVPYEHLFHNANRLGPAEMAPVQNTTKGWCSTPSQFLGRYNYGNAFYTFRHGLAQIIVLNSYSDTSPESVQYRFLQQTLQEYNRRTAPWLVVVFHCPIYTTFAGHVNETQAVRMKQSMEPLFISHGVNFVVTGHDHAYSRSKPIGNNNGGRGRGPIYLALGAGGNRERHSPGYQHVSVPESWIATRTLEDYGYGKLFLANATHAHVTWVKDFVEHPASNFSDR
eukprot:CAMPEP_0178897234 /NCGR_PEP_ID=MMETSP0786-20121207/1631_1 /TAXON_ID=186022 /ORGANISM="Thalassionema frauenfeldii, Strain CCMP 1798" /LENGTH=526 /DNA_ID=CAMNT_0020567757 /DNA_START=149 /DNA_END=1726 /DNA_ORIENTATION=-